LSVRTRVHDQAAIRVEVQDNGVGLRDQDKIFEAFYTTKENGMGLGLPICRSIIELHNGRLWPLTDGRSGTTFCFTLDSTCSSRALCAKVETTETYLGSRQRIVAAVNDRIDLEPDSGGP